LRQSTQRLGARITKITQTTMMTPAPQAPPQPHKPQHAAHIEHGGPVIQMLERLDNWAHVVVAAFFILMATTVIVHMGFIFLRQLPLIVPATPTAQAQLSRTQAAAQAKAPEAKAPEAKAPEAKATEAEAASKPGAEEAAASPADPFVKNSLELLSQILFVVILLELLRTIITYLETHDIQAIMQEFLVVGIISSVRKILLVGAEASLRQGASQSEFIQEASGVVIDILGILLLIAGLVMLKRAFGTKTQREMQEV